MYQNKGYVLNQSAKCLECRDECQDTLYHYCLPHGGKHADAKHIKHMMNCIQMCQTATDFMARNFFLPRSVSEACAEMCDICADSCEAIGGARMKHCANICRLCALACREAIISERHAA